MPFCIPSTAFSHGTALQSAGFILSLRRHFLQNFQNASLESSIPVIKIESSTMAWIWSIVIAGFIFALLSVVIAIRGLDDESKCPLPVNDTSACKVTGPNVDMLRLSGYEKTHQLPYLSGKRSKSTKHSLPTYEILDFALKSSDYKKDQGWFHNGTTKKVDKVNKGILKSKNIGIKYKSKKAKGMSLYKNDDEFFTVLPNSNKDQKEQSKSIKVKQISDRISKDTGNKQLDAYWTTSGYEKSHQLPYLSGERPESTKGSLPTYESQEKAFKKRIGEQQNAENSFLDNRQEPVLKKIPKDTILQKTNENTNEAQDKYTNPKFRTGKILLQLSENDNNEVVESPDDISLSLQRSLKDDPANSWCTLPYGVYNGKLDCTEWSYKKECVLTCFKDNVRDLKTEMKCDRKYNQWEPPLQPCEAIEKLKAVEAELQALPAYEYITGDEEYDEYAGIHRNKWNA